MGLCRFDFYNWAWMGGKGVMVAIQSGKGVKALKNAAVNFEGIVYG